MPSRRWRHKNKTDRAVSPPNVTYYAAAEFVCKQFVVEAVGVYYGEGKLAVTKEGRERRGSAVVVDTVVSW